LIRIVNFCFVGLLLAGVAAAQSNPAPASLAQLQLTAHDKTADWERLAQTMDDSIARLLPCDPKATAKITEVSKASDARAAAVLDYLREAVKQASLQTAAVRRGLASVQPWAADLSAEQSDLAQEHAAVDGQVAKLTGSALGRPPFDEVGTALRGISGLEQQRSDAVDFAISRSGTVLGAARDFASQVEARETALRDSQAAFETENALWTTYYMLRLERAQAECNFTRGVTVAPARPQGKQK